ncbi:MAG: FAD-dependent oxidoreductase, partial [Deltaproteobacteria bacterium]|nr:FAD-dependent oxidoreductase [Deltaproteobacteria bacterium]
WLLPRQLPQPASEMLSRHIESLGITVRAGVRVKELTGDERVHGVFLDNGEEVSADAVVLSTGVRPNSHLARRADLEVASGIIVDDQMFTSDPAILAAGDVAEHRGVLYGIWPASYAQGAVAGINAVGGDSEFKGMPPSNRIKVLDVDLYSIGTVTNGDASFQVCEELEGDRYARLVCRDGRIVGAALYGDTALSGRLKEAIESAAHLTELSDLTERFPALAGAIG